MNDNEFPLEKTNGRLTKIGPRAEQRPAMYRYVAPASGEGAASPGYDSLVDYWHILFRHRKILLSFTLGGLLAAIAISLIQTPIYRVRTSLDIQGSNFMEMKGSNESAGSYGTPESYVETQVKLLQSESLLEDVIDKLKLQDERPEWGLRSILLRAAGIFGWSRISRLPQKQELIKQMQRNLTVQTSGSSHLLEVLYESPNPQRAAAVANTLVSEFIELSQEARWKAAQGTADWLTKHLDEMKVQLEASEAQLQTYALSSGLSVTSESASDPGKENLAESRLKELQDELSKAQAERILNDAKYEEAKSKPADSLAEVQEDPTMREYRQKLADLQDQYVKLSATLTPAHYKVKRVEAQIDELKFEMLQERSNVVKRIGNEYAASRRREMLLSEAHSNQEKIVADQSGKEIHYDTLKRDVDSNRRLYEVMLQRVKEASLTAAMRDSNVMVVDHASAPLLPYRPNLPINMAIGLFGGVLLGFGFVLVRERVDHRISAPGDTQVYLDLPELGVIPLDGAPVSWRMLNRQPAHRATPSLPPVSATSSSLGDCPELATWKRKPSLLAECARTTLTSILLPNQNQNGEGPRVIVLTSPCPGDGKTTVACNLSIAMAEIGRKVLLIDGDLRRPRLHNVFRVPDNWGLSDILWAEIPLENFPISDLARETEVTGLSLLPAGSCGITPSNLFYSPRMAMLLNRLRSEFDMIMIDAPPMIHLADARVLGRLADGVVLVVRAGETTTESALSACQRFSEDGTHVLGTVLNNWDPNTDRRYGYGNYSDYQTHVA